jgi:DNA invertase Pin-like site-specific DNA recombinase
MQQPSPTPAVIYAAKSSPDEHESCDSQIEQTRAKLEKEPGRFLYADPLPEENMSGFTRSRGPELARAIETAKHAAAEHGHAELWVFHSSRLARGSGRKGEARALGQVFYECREAGVTLRSVEDDPYITEEAFVGVASQMANKFSRDLSSHITRGQRRAFEQGEHHGGPVLDGYAREVDIENGKIVARRFVIDPERAAWLRRATELALEGLGSPTIARGLNAEGCRDRNGKPFTPGRVGAALCNPFYAGRVIYHRGQPDEEVRPGNHPAIIDPADFDRIQDMRTKRAPRQMAKGGRKTLRFVLAHGLARCDRCGATMRSVTANGRIRKDGTRLRQYVCSNASHGATACDQPKLDAAKIDAAILAQLDRLFIDFDAWLENVAQTTAGQRAIIEAEHDATLSGLERHAALEDKLRRRYLQAVQTDDPNQRAAEDALNRVLEDGDKLRDQLRGLKEQLAAESEEPPIDTMLDIYNGLARAIQTGAEDTSIVQLNERLHAVFEAFRLDQVDATTVGVLPVLRADCIERYSDIRPVTLDYDEDELPPSVPDAVPAIVWATDPPPGQALEICTETEPIAIAGLSARSTGRTT